MILKLDDTMVQIIYPTDASGPHYDYPQFLVVPCPQERCSKGLLPHHEPGSHDDSPISKPSISKQDPSTDQKMMRVQYKWRHGYKL